MSLTKTFALGMMAAYANARSLQDLPGAEQAWGNVMDYMGDLESTVAQLVLDMIQAKESLAAHEDSLDDHEQSLASQDLRLESLNSDLQDLDGRVFGNEISVMDLYGSQVTHDYFETNADIITVPIWPEYTLHQWTVKAGETLDFAAHISSHDDNMNANGLRLRLYQTADGEEEQWMAMSRVVDSDSRDESADLSMLYRAKVEKDTQFSLRVDTFEQEQTIEAKRAQFGYKTYGPNYEVAVPARKELIFYKGENCDGEEWIVGDIDSLDYQKIIEKVSEMTEPTDWNDKLSSMRIPDNVQVELWTSNFYSGLQRSFEGKTEDVCQQLGDINNMASTIRITNNNVDPLIN